MPAFGYSSDDLREFNVTGVDPHHMPQRLTELSDHELDDLAATAKAHNLHRLLGDITYERQLRKDRVPDAEFFQFWVWSTALDAPTKIALNTRDHFGEYSALEFDSHAGPTDEGSSRRDCLYYLEHDDAGNLIVVAEFHDSGADCDGRYEKHRVNYCLTTELEAGQPALDHSARNRQYESPIIPGITYPNWQKKEAHQRDHSAEAMNY